MKISPAQKFTIASAPVLVLAAIMVALQPSEKRVLTTYWDKIGGVWTVCAGITGPDVIPGKTYTDTECDILEGEYIEAMLKNMGRCATGEMTFGQIKAFGHFAYNVGTPRFCSSTAVKLINDGKADQACAQIERFVYAGGKDCRKAESKCPGIVKRRAIERAWCEGR